MAVPEASPRAETAMPPATSAPVHMRSHGLACAVVFISIFMHDGLPIGLALKPASAVAKQSNTLLIGTFQLAYRCHRSAIDDEW